MKLYAIKIFLIVALSFNCYNAKELPSYIQKCNLAVPEQLHTCLQKNLDIMKPRLMKGIPELHIPAVEPLQITKLEIQAGTFTVVLNDISIFGIKDAKVLEFTLDKETNNVKFEISFPKIYGRGRCSIAGKLLLFELNNNGYGHLNITGLISKGNRGLKILSKNEKHYMILNKKFEHHVTYDKAIVKFEHLFNNQQLMDEINNAINENIQEIAKDVEPVMVKVFTGLFTNVTQVFFNEYSLEELFEGFQL